MLGVESTDNKIKEIFEAELSSFEIYSLLKKRNIDSLGSNKLTDIQLQHKKAVNFWKTQLYLIDELPKQELSLYERFIKSCIKVASIFGKVFTLKLIKLKEKKSLKYYKDLLQAEDLSSFQKKMINHEFIPKQNLHIEKIEELIEHEV